MTDSNNWTLLPFLRDSAGVDTMVTACGIRLDISRQRLTGEDLKRLVDHCRTRGVEEAHRRMMAGEIVNPSEGRAALHTSLRSFSAGAPKFAEVDRERRRMLDFARQVFAIPRPTRQVVLATNKDFIRHSLLSVLKEEIKAAVPKEMLSLQSIQCLL